MPAGIFFSRSQAFDHPPRATFVADPHCCLNQGEKTVHLQEDIQDDSD